MRKVYKERCAMILRGAGYETDATDKYGFKQQKWPQCGRKAASGPSNLYCYQHAPMMTEQLEVILECLK